MRSIAFTAVVLAGATLAGAAPHQSVQWQRKIHEVGESFPSLAVARRLLGPPDSTETVIVQDPEHYAPYQPLVCLQIARGRKLIVWRYRDAPGRLTYLLYFSDGRKACLASVIDGASR